MGPRRQRRQALHPAGAARNGEVARGRQSLRRYRLKSHAEPLATGRAIGQKIGQGTVRLIKSSAEMDRVRRRRRARHRHDRSRLGTGDEARRAIVTNRGGRTCHAAIIARELGIPGGRRLRRRDARAEGRRVGHRLLRGGRHRPRLRGPAGNRDRRRRARPDAAVPDEDHDERRQSRARVRVPAAAERRRGPRAARVHHQPQRRHPSEGAARVRPPAGRPQARDRAAHRRLRQSDRVLRREDRRRRGDDRRRVLRPRR